MYKGKKLAAIVLAGGTGKRMGYEAPKQFMELACGSTILASSISAFAEGGMKDYIDMIIVTSPSSYLEETKREAEPFALANGEKAVVIEGGEERQDSVRKAVLEAFDHGFSEDDLVLVHDAARPFVTEDIILDVAEKAYQKGAAVACVPVKDTIRSVDEGTLDRSRLYQVQTPQGFRLGLIREAEEKAFDEGVVTTDDVSLVERMGIMPEIASGSYSNIKVTTPEDISGKGGKMRIGTGFDVHKLAEGRDLILAGVKIPFEKGLLGHSDADVLTHALMDAMLGGAALGDIGHLFPDSDPAYEGANSIGLLKEVVKKVKESGFVIENFDVTVICERPKLAGYIGEMRKNLSEAAGLDLGKVSVKATTTEKLGFTGRGEGIAAEAVCLLKEAGE